MTGAKRDGERENDRSQERWKEIVTGAKSDGKRE